MFGDRGASSSCGRVQLLSGGKKRKVKAHASENACVLIQFKFLLC